MKRPIHKIKAKPIDLAIEAAGFLALTLLWAYVSYNYTILPDIVPIHFGAGGVPDGYGEKELNFLAPAIATCLFVFITYLQGKPHKLNYATDITENNALAQYTSAVRMMRVLKLALCILFIFIEYSTVSASFSEDGTADLKWMFIGAIFIVQLPVFYFIIQSSKNA